MANILIIDDEPVICRLLSKCAANLGHEPATALDLGRGLEMVERKPFDVVFLDVNLPDGNGLEALPLFRKAPGGPEVVIITGTGDADGAELAIKNDAWDYVQKPVSTRDITLILNRTVHYQEEKRRAAVVPALRNREDIVGSSPRMSACIERMAQAAASDANVLITGETGTGKELFARTIHLNSPRSGGNFVVVDCAALPETLVESMLFGHSKGAFTGADKHRVGLVKEADGGTLFLDEIGELPFTLQKAFLRLLQERRFRPLGSDVEISSNFRLIAATNRDLEKMVEQGRFRRDLYFRIRSLTVHLPPLRQRKEDIKELLLHYHTVLSDRYQTEPKVLSGEFIAALEDFPWPGNVRELIHTLEQAMVVSQREPTLYPRHLPTPIRVHIARSAVRPNAAANPLSPSLPDLSKPHDFPTLKTYRSAIIAEGEKRYLAELMRRSDGDIHNACQMADLGRARLYGLLKQYAVPRGD